MKYDGKKNTHMPICARFFGFEIHHNVYEKKTHKPTEMEILSSGDIPALVSNIEVFSILTKQIDARKEQVSSK